MTTLSREDVALMVYLDDSGVPHRVTATTNHKPLTSAGFPSRHVAQGTDGQGLAIDVATPTPSSLSPGLLAIFDAFLVVEHQLHELIYAGAAFNIKNGKRVKPYAVADHPNHVHVSVDKGVFVVWPGAAHPPEEDELTDDEHKLIVRLEQKLDAVIAALNTGDDGNGKPRGPIGGVAAIIEQKVTTQGLDMGKIKSKLGIG